jgi:hypothetical protein
LAFALASCGDSGTRTACKGGVDSSLVTGAALFQLDDYGATNHCDGNDVADGTIAPLSSHTFAPGAAISLPLPPGAHTLVLYAFADPSGDTPIGSGCVETTLAAGGDFCFDLMLAPVDEPGSDGGAGGSGGGGGGGGGSGGSDGGCSVTHSDGLGDTFVDCVALGTQDTTQAHKAADAWDSTGSINALARSYSDNKGSLLYICDQSVARNACACWTWNGTGQYAGTGRALATAGKPSQCFIPFNGTYPAWN